VSSIDTIFAHSSGLPPAAIAVVRISGPQAHAAGQKLAGTLPEPRQALLRTLRDEAGELLDRAMLLRFDAPASATGEDVIELHLHGGRAVVAGVLATLGAVEGLREARPGEFTRRAFENGRLDLTEAEGLADLLEAETEQQRRQALALAGGALRRQVEKWREHLVLLSARAEASIDYVDDEDETAADAAALACEAQQLGAQLGDWLAQPRAEPLKQGIRVVLGGPPNSGKSSLLNALLGDDKAIVSAEAGTTRDVIEVPASVEGVGFVFVDTAGLHESTHLIERDGIRRARQQMEAADILLWLGDQDGPDLPSAVPVHARADLAGREVVPNGRLKVSAVTGEGLRDLQSVLVSRARTMLPSGDQVALNKRHAAAIDEARRVLDHVSTDDVVLTAEALRLARTSLDQVVGRSGLEDVLDALFGRFCLGK
jgi:tRNA modification GTPase